MKKVAVKIAYLGSDFYGSQIQPRHRTVMGEVQKNLMKVHDTPDKEKFDLRAAGRTDAGVNALGNVISFNTDFDEDKILRALNGVAKDVYYRSVATVEKDFNPRYADARIYRYVIPKDGIDLGKAEKCSQMFVGKHDFSRFCKVDERNTTLTIKSINFETDEENIVLTFEAQFFLWNMIRKISAAIISVGKGKHSFKDVENALNGKDVQFGLARPDALTLVDVVYKNLKFEPLTNLSYKETVEDEIFSSELRHSFFKSLKE